MTEGAAPQGGLFVALTSPEFASGEAIRLLAGAKAANLAKDLPAESLLPCTDFFKLNAGLAFFPALGRTFIATSPWDLPCSASRRKPGP